MAALPLAEVIAAVEAEGERLRAEFYGAGGPRGERGNCPVDKEIEERLRKTLRGLVDCTFVGEETGTTPGARAGWVWLVDPGRVAARGRAVARRGARAGSARPRAGHDRLGRGRAVAAQRQAAAGRP